MGLSDTALCFPCGVPPTCTSVLREIFQEWGRLSAPTCCLSPLSVATRKPRVGALLCSPWTPGIPRY